MSVCVSEGVCVLFVQVLVEICRIVEESHESHKSHEENEENEELTAVLEEIIPILAARLRSEVGSSQPSTAGEWLCTHSRTSSRTHSPLHSLTPSLPHSLAPSLTHSFTHSHMHAWPLIFTCVPLVPNHKGAEHVARFRQWAKTAKLQRLANVAGWRQLIAAAGACVRRPSTGSRRPSSSGRAPGSPAKRSKQQQQQQQRDSQLARSDRHSDGDDDDEEEDEDEEDEEGIDYSSE